MAVEGVKVLGLTGVLEALKALPEELVSKNGGLVRRALRKGGVPILKQAQENVQRIIDEVNKDGRFVSTGLAKKSLRLKRIRPLNGQSGEAFIIAVKPQRYDGEKLLRKSKRGVRAKKAIDLQTNDVLFMLEAGTERRAPMPWMRPAFDAKKQEAVGTFVAEMEAGIEIVKKKMDKIAAARANQP